MSRKRCPASAEPVRIQRRERSLLIRAVARAAHRSGTLRRTRPHHQSLLAHPALKQPAYAPEPCWSSHEAHLGLRSPRGHRLSVRAGRSCLRSTRRQLRRCPRRRTLGTRRGRLPQRGHSLRILRHPLQQRSALRLRARTHQKQTPPTQPRSAHRAETGPSAPAAPQSPQPARPPAFPPSRSTQAPAHPRADSPHRAADRSSSPRAHRRPPPAAPPLSSQPRHPFPGPHAPPLSVADPSGARHAIAQEKSPHPPSAPQPWRPAPNLQVPPHHSGPQTARPSSPASQDPAARAAPTFAPGSTKPQSPTRHPASASLKPNPGPAPPASGQTPARHIAANRCGGKLLIRVLAPYFRNHIRY